jgi:hypothetical protein
MLLNFLFDYGLDGIGVTPRGRHFITEVLRVP